MTDLSMQSALKAIMTSLTTQGTATVGQKIMLFNEQNNPIGKMQAPTGQQGTSIVFEENDSATSSTEPSDTASALTMGKLYLVGPASGTKYQWITLEDDSTNPSTFSWIQIGSTEIDLSQLATFDISLSVVAEALLYLYNENKALRELLSGKNNAVLPYIKAQAIECVDKMTMGVPDVLESENAGAPSAANVPDNWDEETMTVWDGCPRKIGQQYVDKMSKKVYYAVAVTGSTNDWVALN